MSYSYSAAYLLLMIYLQWSCRQEN